MVRVEGLEPPRHTALDPKSSASTTSATPARLAVLTGLEPAISGVTGRRVDPYTTAPNKMVTPRGIEPLLPP